MKNENPCKEINIDTSGMIKKENVEDKEEQLAIEFFDKPIELVGS